MANFIFGARNKIHINLEETLPRIRSALMRCAAWAQRTSFFVGTKRAAAKIVREQASRVGMPYVDQLARRHADELQTIRQSIKRLRDLERSERWYFGQAHQAGGPTRTWKWRSSSAPLVASRTWRPAGRALRH